MSCLIQQFLFSLISNFSFSSIFLFFFLSLTYTVSLRGKQSLFGPLTGSICCFWLGNTSPHAHLQCDSSRILAFPHLQRLLSIILLIGANDMELTTMGTLSDSKSELPRSEWKAFSSDLLFI